MKLHYIFTVALTALMAIPAMAQDRNNEDEVVKVDARFSAYNYREGELIVKFKDQSAAQIKAHAAPSSGRRALTASTPLFVLLAFLRLRS